MQDVSQISNVQDMAQLCHRPGTFPQYFSKQVATVHVHVGLYRGRGGGLGKVVVCTYPPLQKSKVVRLHWGAAELG